MWAAQWGLLALDLAHKHADDFRAVISLEGALEIPGKLEHNTELWHPQVNNEYKARLMDALMSPPLPSATARKPPTCTPAAGHRLLGDLNYYLEDYDLTAVAPEIDTDRVGVHILSAEYDCSGTAELGRAAHEAIPGSTFQEMKNVGHSHERKPAGFSSVPATNPRPFSSRFIGLTHKHGQP